MAVLNNVTILLLTLVVLYSQALEQPRGRRSKRDSMARLDNGTERRLAQLEAKMEGEMQEKLQGVTQRLESMVLELLSSRLESMVSEILTSKLKASEEKVAELVEAKTSATEERLASLEASNTEAQASPAACKYQFLYQYEKEAPRSSADLQRVTKLETELTRLQEKVSALDKRLEDIDHSTESLHNASVLAMEGIVNSMTELVAASEQSLQFIMQNATEIMTFMMNDTRTQLLDTSRVTRTQLLATSQETMAVVNASIASTSKELATRVSAVEEKVDATTSLLTEETGRIKAMLKDIKNNTEELCGTVKYRGSCQDYNVDGHKTSGVYSLHLKDGQGPIDVYCDMSTGPGWVVFQRRQDGSVDFFRNWTSYEDGFGDLNGEFWLGNRNIHRLTSAGLTQLRVDLQAWDGSTVFALYSHFSVGDASSSYMLSVSGYSGTAGDSLDYHNNIKFSTQDQDNDSSSSGNCAQAYKGAWWYSECHRSNLNGLYGARGSSGWQYTGWRHWLYDQSLRRTELKLK